MTDTHTHILPGMDDGAGTLEESLQMLRKSRSQGVQTVVLTPHFYPDRESVDAFLRRRSQAFEQLCAEVKPDMPRLVLGAEVAWCAGLERMERLEALTMGDTRWLLLEMPYMEWTDEQFNSLYDMFQGGKVVPVMAHVERFLHLQRHGQYEALLDMQLPMQISAGAFTGLLQRKKALRLLRRGQWMVGSDCHNLNRRPPCMEVAARCLQNGAPHQTAALHWNF